MSGVDRPDRDQQLHREESDLNEVPDTSSQNTRIQRLFDTLRSPASRLEAQHRRDQRRSDRVARDLAGRVTEWSLAREVVDIDYVEGGFLDTNLPVAELVEAARSLDLDDYVEETVGREGGLFLERPGQVEAVTSGSLPAQFADLQAQSLMLPLPRHLLTAQGQSIIELGITTYESVGPFLEIINHLATLLGPQEAAPIRAFQEAVQEAGLTDN